MNQSVAYVGSNAGGSTLFESHCPLCFKPLQQTYTYSPEEQAKGVEQHFNDHHGFKQWEWKLRKLVAEDGTGHAYYVAQRYSKAAKQPTIF
jgi:hypothetical protein